MWCLLFRSVLLQSVLKWFTSQRNVCEALFATDSAATSGAGAGADSEAHLTQFVRDLTEYCVAAYYQFRAAAKPSEVEVSPSLNLLLAILKVRACCLASYQSFLYHFCSRLYCCLIGYTSQIKRARVVCANAARASAAGGGSHRCFGSLSRRVLCRLCPRPAQHHRRCSAAAAVRLAADCVRRSDFRARACLCG